MLQQGQCHILVYILPGRKGIRAQERNGHNLATALWHCKVKKEKERKMVQVCKLNQYQCSICFCEDNGR